MHIQSLPHTVSSKIGKFYLECIYKSVIKNKKNNFSLVATNNKHIIGVIVATTSLPIFQSDVKKELFLIGYMQIFISLVSRKYFLIELIKRVKFENQLTKQYMDKYATIVILFTDVKFRKKGVATKLTKETIKFYKGKVDNIYVDTLINNHTAQKFYKSMGFSKINKVDSSILFKK